MSFHDLVLQTAAETCAQHGRVTIPDLYMHLVPELANRHLLADQKQLETSVEAILALVEAEDPTRKRANSQGVRKYCWLPK